jgi:predicted anti-sigma-YlaC factor YlaD
MMDCKEFRELVDFYVDGELSPETTLSARAHLEGCGACSRVEQQLLRLRGAVKRVVNEIAPPPELETRVKNLAWPGWHKVTIGSASKDQTAEVPFWRKKIASWEVG